MIERVSNGLMVLRPTPSASGGPKKAGVKVAAEGTKPAEYLYNPDLADKINTSRESIREEMSLLKEAKLTARARQGEDSSVGQKASAAASLDVLRRSLARIKSLLYQVASVAAADPDSLEALQRKAAEELRGYKRIFESIDLNEVVPPDLNLERMKLTGRIDPTELSPASYADSMEAVSAADEVIDRLLEAAKHENEKESLTEAVLGTTEQNLAAAESALYPHEITSRAKEASFSLRDRIPEAFTAQANLQPGQVYGLTRPA